MPPSRSDLLQSKLREFLRWIHFLLILPVATPLWRIHFPPILFNIIQKIHEKLGLLEMEISGVITHDRHVVGSGSVGPRVVIEKWKGHPRWASHR